MVEMGTVEITPFSPVGAEIRNVDLSGAVENATLVRIAQAFVDHSLIVVRDQALTAPQLAGAMSQFGEPFAQHVERYSIPECPIVHYISNQEILPNGKNY